MLNDFKVPEILGTFITPVEKFQLKQKNIKALVFDWDGVFNDGRKDAGGSSNFSEVDSMGTNLLRYSYYLLNSKMPATAIISGERNETAFYFCEREGFHNSYFKIGNKIKALDHFCELHKIEVNEVAYFFDDVLDLSIAEKCGLRIMVNQKANAMLINYCIKNNMVDYLCANSGGTFAIREACELMIGLNNNFDEVIDSRKNFDEKYNQYLSERKLIKTEFFTLKEGEIISISNSKIGFGN